MGFLVFLGLVAVVALILLVNAKSARRSGTQLTPAFDPGPTMADGLNLDWQIVYTDRDGETTTRTITVKSLHGEQWPKYAFAFCHLRKEPRHFNLYNIQKAVDARTGKSVPVTDHLLDWIRDHP